MRTMLIATAGLAIAAAGGAAAQQRVVMHGPMQGSGQQYLAPGQPARLPPPPMVNTGRPMMQGGQPMVRPGQPRWGSKVGGRWWGGANAPGGWSAYRRPYRGWTVPSYWVAPRFYVTDWAGYGLSQPGDGYNWVRYYDDAVLVDGRGSVQDSVSGVDWDRYDDGYYTDDAEVYAGPAERGYAQGGYAQQEYRQPGYAQPAPRYDDRRDSSGIGGAVAGAVVGGVAGNLIAGHGNRLGGTLIGAGVGTAAGYAIDRSANHRRVEPAYGAPYGQPDYDTGYRGRPPVAPSYAPPPPRYAPPTPPRYAPPAPIVQPLPPQYREPGHGGQDWESPDGSTTVTTTTSGGYAAHGYYYPGGSTTTVVVRSAPVVTTTTTEIYEDAVTYVKPAARRVKTKRVWRPRPVCRCN